jgi:hypothetical protein
MQTTTPSLLAATTITAIGAVATTEKTQSLETCVLRRYGSQKI